MFGSPAGLAVVGLFALQRMYSPPWRLDALDCILRGRAVAAKSRSAAVLDEAIAWYERALALDPASSTAQARLAVELAPASKILCQSRRMPTSSARRGWRGKS